MAATCWPDKSQARGIRDVLPTFRLWLVESWEELCFEGKLARGKLGTHGPASLLYLSPVKKDGVGSGPDVNQSTPGHPWIPKYHITGSAFLAWVPRPGWVMMILYTYPSCSSSWQVALVSVYCLCRTCHCRQSPDMALVVGSHSHCSFTPSPDGCCLHIRHLCWITKPQAFLVPSSGLVSASLSLWSVATLYQGICPADCCPHGPSSPVYTPRQQEAMGYRMWVLEDHFPCRYSTETSRNLRYGAKPLSGPKPATPPWRLQGLLASLRTWGSISLVAYLGCRFCLFPFDLEVCPRQGNLQFNCFDLNKFLFEM